MGVFCVITVDLLQVIGERSIDIQQIIIWFANRRQGTRIISSYLMRTPDYRQCIGVLFSTAESPPGGRHPRRTIFVVFDGYFAEDVRMISLFNPIGYSRLKKPGIGFRRTCPANAPLPPAWVHFLAHKGTKTRFYLVSGINFTCLKTLFASFSLVFLLAKPSARKAFLLMSGVFQ